MAIFNSYVSLPELAYIMIMYGDGESLCIVYLHCNGMCAYVHILFLNMFSKASRWLPQRPMNLVIGGFAFTP